MSDKNILRFLVILLVCLLCFGMLSCLIPVETQTGVQPAIQTLLIEQPLIQKSNNGFEYYAAVYLQWIILGAYILTTLIMAFYTNKKDKKKVLNAKKVADTLILSRRGRPGMLLKVFHFLFGSKRK